ncbi:hypothetical protein RCL1_002224 [Eukaryota sp. TZLM3-RCL]
MSTFSPARLPSASLNSSLSDFGTPTRVSTPLSSTPKRSPAFSSADRSAASPILQSTIKKLKESNRALLTDLQREREYSRLSSDTPSTVASVRKKYEAVIFNVRGSLDQAKSEIHSLKNEVLELKTQKDELKRQLELSRDAEELAQKRISKFEMVLDRARKALGTSMTSNELLIQLRFELEDEQIGLQSEANKFAELANSRGLEVQRLKTENEGLKRQLSSLNTEFASQTQQFLKERESWSLEISDLRRHVQGDGVISEIRVGSESKRKGLSNLIKNLQDKGRNQSSMLEEFLTRMISSAEIDTALLEYTSDLLAEQKNLKTLLAQSRKELQQLKGGSLEGGCVRTVANMLETKLATAEKNLKDSRSVVSGLNKRLASIKAAVESIFIKISSEPVTSDNIEACLAEIEQKMYSNGGGRVDRKAKPRGATLQDPPPQLQRSPSFTTSYSSPIDIFNTFDSTTVQHIYPAEEDDVITSKEHMKSLSLALIRKKDHEKRKR